MAAAPPAGPGGSSDGGAPSLGDARIRAAATTTSAPTAPPRLVSDADLARSLSSRQGDDPLPRAYAPLEPRICRCCAGTTIQPCPTCAGTGSLPPGGYRATNPVIMPKIVGTTWTAAERTLGRTHFRCADKRRAGKLAVFGGGGGDGAAVEAAAAAVEAAASTPPPAPSPSPPPPPPPPPPSAWFVLMVSACDPSIRLWVEAKALKDRARWTPGWVTVADVVARREADAGTKQRKQGVGPRAGAGCKACGGSGRVACRLCSRAGQVIEV